MRLPGGAREEPGEVMRKRAEELDKKAKENWKKDQGALYPKPGKSLWLLLFLITVVPIHFYLGPGSFWERLIVIVIIGVVVYYIVSWVNATYRRMGG